MTYGARCQHGRLQTTGLRHGTATGCPNRPDGESVYCAFHRKERLESLYQLPPKRRIKPQRWGQTYVVMGNPWE